MLRGQTKDVSRAEEALRVFTNPKGKKPLKPNLGYCGPIPHISEIHKD
jgi:hypothetical protein